MLKFWLKKCALYALYVGIYSRSHLYDDEHNRSNHKDALGQVA